jgi:hypothetical protein
MPAAGRKRALCPHRASDSDEPVQDGCAEHTAEDVIDERQEVSQRPEGQPDRGAEQRLPAVEPIA